MFTLDARIGSVQGSLVAKGQITPYETVRARLMDVESMLISKASPRIIEHTLSKKWGISHRQVRNYIARVQATWDAEAPSDARLATREVMRKSLASAAHRALSEGDVNQHIRALDMLARLDGLYAPQRTEAAFTGSLGATPPPVDPLPAVVVVTQHGEVEPIEE